MPGTTSPETTSPETTNAETTSAADIPTRVLLFGMAHRDGTIVASEVLPVAEACGQSAEQVRSCLRRLVTEGLFVRRGSGQDARYEPTARGSQTLGGTFERTRLAYAQDAAGRGWDRRWRLAAFAIPEARRSARDALRDRLVALGGAAIQGGLYVSPHPWHKDVLAEAGRLEVTELVTLATTDELDIGGERDPRDLARQLWPLDELARQYQTLIERFAWIPDRLAAMRRERRRLPDEMFLPGAIAIAVAWQEVFERDPLLPPELLPRPWPGRTARDLMVRSRRLALGLRESQLGPALFHQFDDAVESIR